jgi:hypothetical protein
MFSLEELESLGKANAKLGVLPNERRGVIFIYCPPKVGSTSLVSFIRIFASDKYIVLHIHDEVMLKVLFNISDVTVNDIIQYNAHLGREVFVIDIYRAPIERKISHFFEELSTVHFNNTEENLNTYDVGKIVARFNKVFPYVGSGDHYLEKYGLRLSEIPSFDFSKKMMYVEKNGVKYVKLRLKDSSSWSKTLRELLKTEIITRPDHETDKKPLKELYSKFKANYKIPENLMTLIMEDSSLSIFYSKEEREDYIKKWSTTVTLPCVHFTPNEYKMYYEIGVENSLYMKIKYDHYLDNGCTCSSCSAHRLVAKKSVKMGIQKIERIVHQPKKSPLQQVKSMLMIYK